MANSGEESVTNRNGLFAKISTSTLSKPGITPEFVHDQLLLIARLVEKTSKAATINPNFEPTQIGLKNLKECVSTVNGVLKSINPELAKDADLVEDTSYRSSYNP